MAITGNMKKDNHKGGDRGGRKPLKYGEPVKRKTFQYPGSKQKEFIEAVKAILKKWEKKKRETP